MRTEHNKRQTGAGIGPEKPYAPVFYEDPSPARHFAIRCPAYRESNSACLLFQQYRA